MTGFAIAFTAVFALALGALFFLMPSLVPRTLPLGVSVPNSRVGDPVIARSVRRYRVAVLVVAAGALIVGILLALVAPAVSVTIAPLLTLVAGASSYLIARRAIVAAKRGGRWYDGVEVRLTAEVTPPMHRRPPAVWAIASIVILVVGFGIGVALYPGLPQVMPTHWNATGVADATAEKSVWTVFELLFVALILAVGFYGISWGIAFAATRRTASDSPEQAQARQAAVRSITTSGLGQLSVALSALFVWNSILIWTGNGELMLVAAIVTICVLLAIILEVVLRYRLTIARVNAGVRKPSAGASRSAGYDGPDDDRHWRGGLIYVNRDDSATFVPKRFGVGWTLNLGSPGGAGILVALVVVVVVVVGSIVFAAVGAGS